jgi:multicomponent Na+:H+ antiporter subunit G
MQETIGTLIIIIGVVFVAIGVIGIYRFDNFYARALVSSKVDTVGYLTLMIGVMIKNGFSFFSLKVFVILVITMIINPLITHSMVRSAHISGYKIGKE